MLPQQQPWETNNISLLHRPQLAALLTMQSHLPQQSRADFGRPLLRPIPQCCLSSGCVQHCFSNQFEALT